MDSIIILFIINFYLIAKGILLDGVKTFAINPLTFSASVFTLVYIVPITMSNLLFDNFKFSRDLEQIILFGAISFYLGVSLVKKIRPLEQRNHYEFSKENIIFLFLSGVALMFFLFALKGIPILSTNIEIARQKFASGSGFILWPVRVLLYTGVWVSFYSSRNKQGLLFLVIACALLLLTGWRGGIVYLILGSYIIRIIKGAFRIRDLLLISASGVLFAVSAIIRTSLAGNSLFGYSSRDLSSVQSIIEAGLTYIVGRLSVQVRTFQEIINFPSEELLYGQGIVMDLSIILPGGGDTLVYYRKNKIGWFDSGGGLPPTIFGSFYIDFGFPGVIIIAFIVGLLYSMIVKSCVSKILDHRFLILLIIAQTSFLFSGFGTFFAYFVPQLFVFYIGINLIILMLPKK